MRQGGVVEGSLVKLTGSRYWTDEIVTVLSVKDDGYFVESVTVEVGGRLAVYPPRDFEVLP